MGMVRMNPFQRMTRCWDHIHPYNAAQIMQLSIPCSATAARSAWDGTLADLGLGRTQIRGKRYRHIPGSSPMMEIPPEVDPDVFISDQLNTPFDPQESPFRAFVQPAGQAMRAGIIYHHWVADSVSIRILMREWFFRLTGAAEPRRQALPMLGEDPSSVPSSRLSLLELVRRTRSLKSCRRLPRAACRDLRVEHRLIRFPDGTARVLHDVARGLGVKVTDLLLSTLAEICQRHLRTTSSRRPNLALGTTRDSRPMHQLDDADAFGAALTLANVVCPADILSRRFDLLAHIAAQTALQRDRRDASVMDLEINLALLICGLFGQHRTADFFRRRMPLCGGLSNADLSRAWVAQYPGLLSDYYRVSPAGPSLPLVITSTTFGQRFNISLTWRKSVFSQTAVEAIQTELREGLASWSHPRERILPQEHAA